MNTTSSILPLFLPRINPDCSGYCCINDDPDANLDHASRYHGFSLQRLTWAVQHGAEPKCIKRYLQSFSASSIATELGIELKVASGEPSFPILYFAVERNAPEIVRILCDAGAQPDQRMRSSGTSIIRVPLLAYAIFSAEYDLLDTNQTVITLLAMGANPSDVPRDMWEDYMKSPIKDNRSQLVDGETDDLWCTPELRAALCRNLNLAQQYFLWNAAQIERPNTRMKQLAQADKISLLFEIPYHIIGQQQATRQVIDCIRNHAHLKITKPLVLLFTGLSGHGKTELASRMGDLLSLETLRVDCTEMTQEEDMFGCKGAYQGSDVGTPLNNYLAQWTGQRAVIFLDEFDETTVSVRKMLLLPFEDGSYRDRRDQRALDCSKFIWILASNLGVEAINRFWTTHLMDRKQAQQTKAPYHELQTTLQQIVTFVFRAPLVGRLSIIVPFLPFDKGEQAVATYKFMREMWNERRKPINTSTNELIQHIHLNYVNEGQIATHLAKKGYSVLTGARPLRNTVNREIGLRLTDQFSREDGEVVEEMNEDPLPNYDVRVVTLGDDTEELQVKRFGSKQTLSDRGQLDE